jgi:hypothetical protein
MLYFSGSMIIEEKRMVFLVLVRRDAEEKRVVF